MGRVFFGGGFGSYEFYALDAKTGQLAWRLQTTDDGPTAAIVEDGLVVYNTESCTVEAVDARTGRRLWHRWLGDPLMSQPAAADGKVYVAYPGGDGRHYLVCMVLRTGRTLWKRAIRGDIISAPVVHGGSVYLATLDGTVYRYAARTGRMEWQIAYNATSAPWLADEELFTSVRETNVGGIKVPPGTSVADAIAKLPRYPGQDPQRAPIEHYESFTRLDGRGQVLQHGISPRAAAYLSAKVNAARVSGSKAKAADAGVGFETAPSTAKIGQAQSNLGANTVSEVWAYQGSRPVVIGRRHFHVQNEVLQCLDARTGKAIWRLRLPADRQSTRTLTPPSAAGDRLFFGTSRGEIACVRQSDGKMLWIYGLGSPIPFQPAVVQGKVYVGTEEGSLYCIDTRDTSADGWAMWGGSPAHNG
jgi:Ca-activated chloride channel family protein